MTLPFRKSDERTWQCFVCMLEFAAYTEFHEHIISKHEQGKDYVVCPKCAAPIRCLVLHFKSRHSGWSIPPGVQLRATVWRDQHSRKKKTSVKFKTGTFISKKNNKEIYYRSGLEKEVYELLEQDHNVVGFGAETLKIPYLYQGEWHNYIPDLTIMFTSGQKSIWEIKPKSQTSLPVNEAKWSHAQQFCDKMGLNFMILTEDGVARLKKQIYINNSHNENSSDQTLED